MGEELMTGENVQEVAEPVVTDNSAESEVVETGANEPAAAEPEQTPDVNAQYAAARRQAEANYRKEIDSINGEFKRLFGNVVNPLTNKPIETYQDYLQAAEHQMRANREAEMKSKGIDPAIIDQMFNQSPTIRQAEAIIQQSRMQEAGRKLDEDMKALSKIDPSIKSFDDLGKHESFHTVLQLVKNNGLSLSDAFILANHQRLSTNKADAAKQAAINAAKSQSHMETTKGSNTSPSNTVPIPDSVLSKWREVYPDLSLDELTQKYNSVI